MTKRYIITKTTDEMFAINWYGGSANKGDIVTFSDDRLGMVVGDFNHKDRTSYGMCLPNSGYEEYVEPATGVFGTLPDEMKKDLLLANFKGDPIQTTTLSGKWNDRSDCMKGSPLSSAIYYRRKPEEVIKLEHEKAFLEVLMAA